MTYSASALISGFSRLLFMSLVFGLLTNPVNADDETIIIELNKTEDTEQGCRPLFLFDNRSGHQLNRFQVELVLFDDKGVYSKQILLDMAPLYKGKKTLASFLLADTRCDEIGSILVNDLPACENSTSGALDCLALLEVTSKSNIALEK
jgi:hypothetical protein